MEKANKIIPIGCIFNFFEIYPWKWFTRKRHFMHEDPIFSCDRNRRECLRDDTCDRVPSVHSYIVEFLFRNTILISDVGGSVTAEVNERLESVRGHAAISSGRTRLVYKNFLSLTRCDLLASDRTTANSVLAKSRGTCRDASRRIASRRVVPRCRYATWRRGSCECSQRRH